MSTLSVFPESDKRGLLTPVQIGKELLIVSLCPLLGGVPFIAWLTYALTGKQLEQVGTGNISVSAAFQQGGTLVRILAVVSEAFKGIAAVLLARFLFPSASQWELIALIALIIGRYWLAQGAGATNAAWGVLVHDPVTAGWVVLLGGIGFVIVGKRRWGRLVPLMVFPLILALRHPDQLARMIAAIALLHH